jgi:predicted PurR-regulated permease PerM
MACAPSDAQAQAFVLAPLSNPAIMPTEGGSRRVHDTLERAIRRSGFTLPPPVFARVIATPDGDVRVRSPQQLPQARVVTAGAVAVLATLAVFYTLHVARPVVLPIVMAILASFLLRGFVRWFRRRGIPEPIGAAIVVFGSVVIVLASLVLLSGPARSWVERAPQAIGDVEAKLRAVTRPMLRWEATARRVEQIASGSAPTSAAPATAQVASGGGLVRRAFGEVASLLLTGLSVMFLTYFLLASGDLFMRKVTKVFPATDQQPGVAREISEEVELAVSRYLRTSVLINLGMGVATWGVLFLLDMPNAGLWGTMAALLNFVPYLGAFVTLGVFTVAAITVFDTISQALLIPIAFLVLNLIESNLVTPMLLGRQFPLNTVALFIGVMLWGFVWGVPGAILAVPIMVTLKIVTDRVPALRPFGEFLGQ